MLIHLLRGLAILGLACAALIASQSFHWSTDVTAARRHTLSPASLALLDAIDGPVTATAFVKPGTPPASAVLERLVRYRAYKSDFEPRLEDPDDLPDPIRSGQVRPGELLLAADGRTVTVSTYDEQAVANGLVRLIRGREQWLAFVTGHGERRADGSANHDLAEWATVLERRGLYVRSFELVTLMAVPDNAAALVIAGAALDFLPAENAAIERYLEEGGNLLWLVDPEALHPSALADYLGIGLVPGTIVDPITQALGIDNPAIAVVRAYPAYPPLVGFDLTTLFPYAAGLHHRMPQGWSVETLWSSNDKAWCETQPLDGSVGFDADVDVAGPVPLALKLTRRLGNRDQRVVIVGDGDFLSNSYLVNAGNQDLGVRLAEYVAAAGALVEIPSRAAPDTRLEFETWQELILGGVFLLVLPLAFAANGALVWWRRRRA